MICHAPVSPCAFLVGYRVFFPEADHETAYSIPLGFASSGLFVGKPFGVLSDDIHFENKARLPEYTLGNSQFHSLVVEQWRF